MSAWSGQVRVDIQLISRNALCYSQLRRLTGNNLLTFFLTYLLTFFLTYLLTFFLTYLLTFFLTFLLQFFLTYVLTFFLTFLLTYLLTCFLTSSDILSDISKTKHSIHSFTQKPLHKLYIYLTPRSKSSIHDNFVSVKWQCYSCIRLHQTAPPRSSWVQRCKKPMYVYIYIHDMHQTAPPTKSSWVPRCHASEHTAAATSHGVCQPWSPTLATVALASLLCRWLCSAQHWFATRELQPPKTTPTFGRLEHASPTLARPPHLQ